MENPHLIPMLKFEIEKLRKALKPFAECCNALEESYPERREWKDNVAAYSGMRSPTMGELRQAREALDE